MTSRKAPGGKNTVDMEILRRAASSAVDFVSSGMVVGLGTGKAASLAIEELAERVRRGVIRDIVCIPTSIKTASFGKSLGLKTVGFTKPASIDITIDGADEVDRNLNLIKGGGGAMLREKVVSQASARNVILVDESKISVKLGTRRRLPVEVVPFALRPVERFLSSIGAVSIDLRTNKGGRRFITDQKNCVFDCDFGPMYDPKIIADSLIWRAGIVEHGLFLKTATDVMVATTQGVNHLRAQ